MDRRCVVDRIKVVICSFEQNQNHMSIFHSVKCSKEQAQEFKKVVRQWLDERKLPYSKILALTAYDGEVRIYNGIEIDSIPSKRSRRFIFADPDTGERLYERAYHSHRDKEYYPVYRTEWDDFINDAKEQDWLIKSLTKSSGAEY